jgi:hypothetical protein
MAVADQEGDSISILWLAEKRRYYDGFHLLAEKAFKAKKTFFSSLQ